MRPTRLSRIAAATAAALATIPCAEAVNIGTDGMGQALVFPYYTVRSANGNAFNTYLSVVNTTSDAKAVRVRLREGRAARPVLDFNLYLSPNDVWAAAVVPNATGAQLVTQETSCTDPAFAPAGSSAPFGGAIVALPLHANSFTGTNVDGFGDTLDRTREGYVEIIEMATLSGASAAAVTHNSAGIPANCAAIRATTTMIVGAPSGGLSGTLTLINVNSGLDFTLDATALEDLSTRAFFRPPGDPYPDWTATEIAPVSVVLAHGNVYRSQWARPLDAVSAVLMSATWVNEYVMDSATASLTDVVIAQPTRHHYANPTSASPPYSAPVSWTPGCSTTTSPVQGTGEAVAVLFFDREERGFIMPGAGFPNASVVPALCAAVGVASVRIPSSHVPNDVTRNLVFGSTTQGLGRNGSFFFESGAQNGWMAITPAPSNGARPPLVSQPSSTRTDVVTGQVTAGSHTYSGLPVVGFIARTFANGTLSCAAGACQGNYGGAFPFRYVPAVEAP